MKHFKENRRVFIQAALSEMAESTVRLHVGSDQYEAIKADDEHPMFIGLDVGSEGWSYGAVEGHPFTSKRWMRRTIQELAGKLNGAQIPIMEGHDKKKTRPDLGSALSGFTSERDERLHAYGIGYITDERGKQRINSGELDVCSIEAECEFESNDADEWEVRKVLEVSAIALANSEFETPGFESAGIVAIINELQSGGESMKKPGEEYTRNELLDDPVVKQLIDDGRQRQYEDLKAVREELGTAKAEIDRLKEGKNTDSTELADLKKAFSDLSKQVAQPQIVAALSAAITKQTKLNKTERELIATDLAGLTVPDGEDADAFIEAAVGKEATRYETLRKLYGKGTEVPEDENPDEEDGKDEGKKKTGDDFLDENPVKK